MVGTAYTDSNVNKCRSAVTFNVKFILIFSLKNASCCVLVLRMSSVFLSNTTMYQITDKLSYAQSNVGELFGTLLCLTEKNGTLYYSILMSLKFLYNR
jgi:hypothetical protein